MKLRTLIPAIASAAAMPLAILTSQFLGATLPLIPAAIISAILCGSAAWFFGISFWNLIH